VYVDVNLCQTRKHSKYEKYLGVNTSLVKNRLSQMVFYGTPTSVKRLLYNIEW